MLIWEFIPYVLLKLTVNEIQRNLNILTMEINGICRCNKCPNGIEAVKLLKQKDLVSWLWILAQ